MKAARGNAVIVTVKPWWRSVVLWIGILTFLSGGIDYLLGSLLLGKPWLDIGFMVKGVLESALRLLRTNEPLA